eukprot:7563868-Ditylum_brightwellii.AAC.1
MQAVECHYDEEEIIYLLQTDIKLYFVSDGGKVNGLGYYGWAIATNMEILCTQKGYSKGNPKLI